MEQGKNELSMFLSGVGICLQMGALIVFLAERADIGVTSWDTFWKSAAFFCIGAGLLCLGLSINARGRWQSSWLGLYGLLSIFGAIYVAMQEDLHAIDRRKRLINKSIADLPDQNSVAFYCSGCQYQLNGITSRACPECGQSFNPDDLTTVLVTSPQMWDAPWQGRWSVMFGLAGLLVVFGCGFSPILAIIGIILGHVALKDIKKLRRPGLGVAIFGLITNYASLVLFVVLVVFFDLLW